MDLGLQDAVVLISHWHAAMQAKYFTYIHAMDAVLQGMVERGARRRR